jgi:hypothetical protein
MRFAMICMGIKSSRWRGAVWAALAWLMLPCLAFASEPASHFDLARLPADASFTPDLLLAHGVDPALVPQAFISAAADPAAGSLA